MALNEKTKSDIQGSSFIVNVTDIYFTTDTVPKKFWYIDIGDTSSFDDGVNVLVNIATNVRFKFLKQDYVNAKWFDVVGDGITNDTNAIQVAVDFVLKYKMGELIFPAGTYIIYHTIEIKINSFVTDGSITIKGIGKKSTIFQGITANSKIFNTFSYYGLNEPIGTSILHPLTITPDTWPIFHVQADPDLNSYVSFEHLSIRGSNFIEKGWYTINEEEPKINYLWLDQGFHELTCLKLELTAIFYLEDVEIINSKICVHTIGALVFNINNFVIGGAYGGSSSYKGILTEMGTFIDAIDTNYIYSNAITLTNGRITYCKNKGIDFGQGVLLNLRSLDIEANGSLMLDNLGNQVADPDTGAVFIRNDVNLEGGRISQININECWFESNYGYTFYTKPVQDNILNFYGCNFATKYPDYKSLGISLDLAGISFIGVKKVNIFGCVNHDSLKPFFINANEIVIIGSSLANLGGVYVPTIPVLTESGQFRFMS